MRQIDHIVIHCTAGSQKQSVESIKNYWKTVLGWKNPGYHDIIQPDGKVVKILPISEISNGVAGHNARSLHVSWIGGVKMISSVNAKGQPINVAGHSIDNRTPEQLLALEVEVWNYHRMFPHATICGHRDFSPDKNKDGIITPNEWLKACPSFDVATWLKEIGINQ